MNQLTGIIAVLALLAVFRSDAQKAGHFYPVAFYNVENLFDTIDNPSKRDEAFTPAGDFKYTTAVYNKKLQNIAHVIAGLKADIIGLAEVENDSVLKALTLQPAIKKNNYRYISTKGADPRGINVALLYNPVRFKLLHHASVAVPLSQDTTRDILFACGILAGDTIYILVNHWPSRWDGKQKTQPYRVQAATINKHIADSLLSENSLRKILVMGDLNDNPDDSSILHVLKTASEKENLQPGTLYNPWFNIYKTGNGTLLYKKHWDLFDQILLSPSFLHTGGLLYRKAEICRYDYLFTQTGRMKGYPHRSFAGTSWIYGYSDHLPVMIYLERTNK